MARGIRALMRQPTKLALARLSTGTKMLLILSAALLPLGFIALLTSLDMARSAAIERRIAAEAAAAIHAASAQAVIDQGLSQLGAVVTSQRSAAYLCAELARQSRLNPAGRWPIATFDRNGRGLCQSYGRPIERFVPSGPQGVQTRLDPSRRSLRFSARRASDGLLVEIEVPVERIRPVLGGDEVMPLARLSLRQGAAEVILVSSGQLDEQDVLRVSHPLAGGKLALTADYRLAPARARTALLIMLPIMMWAAAAWTGWFIVSRLLLLPLGQLKQAIDSWQGGRTAFRLPRLTTPSHEIRDLADSFAAAAARIREHDGELEQGLERQTKLTREVHHRVKNNLQVVSSLINLHARGAEGPVADAYAAIQRRVDALAVVHRNHYAELEEHRGVSIRALAGELATSLRASAPAEATGMPIALNLVDAYVTQDIAVPVSFIITEVVELLMYCNPRGSVLISLEATEEPGRADLRIETVGMAEGAINAYPGLARFDRVVTGIARQFRAPLSQDLQAGRFAIRINTIV